MRRTIIETSKARPGNGTPYLVKDYPKSKRSRLLGLSAERSEAVISLIAVRRLGPGNRLFSVPALEVGADRKVKSDDPTTCGPRTSPGCWPAGPR